jgi:iron complex outermembrane recepter protein
MKRIFVKLVALGGAAFVAGPVAAQQAQPQPGTSNAEVGIEEIVVTAQKRSENMQSVPLAITALSGENLAERNITDVGDLAASVPNMTFGDFGGSARISIRGVGLDNIAPGQEGRVAYYLDGVYIARPSAILGTFYDVDRAEVLRGPQGTLYGRNATGGAINVISNAPTDDWNGYLQVGYGNYNDVTSEGAVGGPIAAGVRFRVAYTFEDNDGYGKNVITGHDIDDARRHGVRGTVEFDLGSSGKLDLSADYYREKDDDYGNHYLGRGVPSITPPGFLLGGFVPSNVRDIASDFDPINDRESYGLTARAENDLGGGVTLKSISAFRHSDSFNQVGFDGISTSLGELFYADRSRQLSQELQLTGTVGSLNYIFGGYYFDEKVFGFDSAPFSLALFGGPNQIVQGYRVQGNIHTRAAAGFGQLDYDLTSQLTLTFGGRYSWEKHTINDESQFDLGRPYPPQLPILPIDGYIRQGASSTDTAFTPKFEMQYKPAKDLMLYASASKGFKSGGFDIGGGAPAFKPETLWDYEGGVKDTFADGRVRINAAGFYYDYRNLQVTKVVNTQLVLVNAASSVVYGAEAELTVIPIAGLQLDASPAWLHSEYKDFSTVNSNNPFNTNPVNLAGNQLDEAPKFMVHAGAEYKWPAIGGELKLRGELAYTSRIYFDAFNTPQLSRAPNTKFNSFLNFSRDHWEGSLYVLNLTNKTTIGSAVIGAGFEGYPILGTLEPPRTYGIKLGYHF